MYFKNFAVIGITHRELNLEEREIFIKNRSIDIIEELHRDGKISGYVTLSTCLRVEIYVELSKDYTIEEFMKFYPEDKVFMKRGHEAVDYLFRVACGFESVIKGEDQILAQVKKSFSESLEESKTTTRLNVTFNKAIELGKKFRHRSKICENALSLEAISLRFLKGKVENLQDKKILILGIGDLSFSIMKLLIKDGIENVTITNRSHHKALEIRESYPVKVVSFSEKIETTIESDIIISATSAPHYVVKLDELKNRFEKREYIFLDLAVPRDIEEGIGELENISLYNLDDIWDIHYNNLENRDYLVEKYEYMLEEQNENLKKWFYYKERIEG